jgi:hypothetical protein
MVVETQVKINQESADLILFEMQKQTKYSLNATVNFDTPENGLSYNPTKNEFIASFEKVLTDM